jgi:hypothetical protein
MAGIVVEHARSANRSASDAETTTRELIAEPLRELARAGRYIGAQRAVPEIVAIKRTFPELKLPQRRRAVRQPQKRGHVAHAGPAVAPGKRIDWLTRDWAERR